MWNPPQAAYAEALDDGQVMRTPAHEDDVERVAAFNGAIHGPEVASMTRGLLLEHPDMEPEDAVFVENAGGDIVSSLCLIPWTWSCDGASLAAGEMGIVGTSEAYRKRGLIRAQAGYFKRRLRERGCVLSHIQGIGYFYRQFGYQYALPLEGGYRLELRSVPSPGDSRYSLRLASADDASLLATLYGQAVDGLCFRTVRSADIWRYLLTRGNGENAMFHETWIAEDGEGNAKGYMRIPSHHFGEELVVDETSVERHEATVAVLDHAKKLAGERGKPGIRLNLPASSYAVRLALACGATALGTYAWQIHIPDDAALLMAMKPALERRLAGSAFAGWCEAFHISFYRRALALNFDGGSLAGVESIPPPADPQVSMPYAAFAPLVFSHHSVDELRKQYPDLNTHGASKLLLETLFPKRESFIYPVY